VGVAPRAVYNIVGVHELGVGDYAEWLLGDWHDLAVTLIERKDLYAAP
jgi:hypothetical protein